MGLEVEAGLEVVEVEAVEMKMVSRQAWRKPMRKVQEWKGYRT